MSAPCPSDLRLDRHLLGELPDADACDVAAHAAACADCAARLSALTAQRDTFAAAADAWRAPTPVAAPHVPRRRGHLGLLAGGLAAAAVAGFLARPLLSTSSTYDGTTKGGTRVSLYLQHGDATREAAASEPAAAGDRLQVLTHLREPAHVAVLSLDGARKVSVFYPHTPHTAPQPAGEGVPVPQSTVLDATPGAEYVLVLVCRTPQRLDALVQQLPQVGAERVDAPQGCELARYVLHKAEAP